MFSRIENITPERPREAESTDTRQAIQRHDPDQERRKRKKKESAESALFSEEDDAFVSLEALQVFLNNFLRTQIIAQPGSDGQSDIKADVSKQEDESQFILGEPPSRTVRCEAARAAHVYEAAAETVSAATPSPPREEANMSSLSAAEVRAIHALLEDLTILKERGVRTLRIEPSDSFLHALSNAVAKSKHSLLS